MRVEPPRLLKHHSWGTRISSRLCRGFFTLPLAMMTVCGIAAVAELRRLGADESPQAPSSSGKAIEKQREGTLLTDVTGYFRLSGDRAMFFAENGIRYGGLENLNLERVANIINENPEQLQWIVSGTVSEYRGANYLLISRVTLKAKPVESATPAVKRSGPASL